MAGRVFVFGSLNMDIVASVPLLPVLGETVASTTMTFLPGGKGGNQAVAAARAGAPTSMIGRVGEDAFGRTLRRFLADNGVDVARVESVGDRPTGTALVTVDTAGDNTVVISSGANDTLAPAAVDVSGLTPEDVVVAQFESPVSAVSTFLAAAGSRGATTVLNAAPARDLPPDLESSVDILVVNENELATLSGRQVDSESPTSAILSAITAVPGSRAVATIATVGSRGVVGRLGDLDYALPARPVRAVDTAGAGDCFVGVLAARIAAGDDLGVGIRHANTAASLCVQRPGGAPAMPTWDEIERSA
ncbi:Ribokinase [Frankia alni ACN14a]|uniref:Ribokinase n=1 Tax=Frankia alni (strain DSM 45986 / CECT 9034 / ACN14a) TaxID=326424 RepID=Q0RIR1_FRAAA|nr:Ribokinase [Frankia alni ACN14a]